MLRLIWQKYVLFLPANLYGSTFILLFEKWSQQFSRHDSNIEILKLEFSVKVNMKSFSKIKRTFVKPKFSWFRAAILPIFPNTYYKNES